MYNNKKINYVIATWAGKRKHSSRNCQEIEEYLHHHLLSLKTIKNNIDQITIMKPNCDIKSKYYTDLPSIDNLITIDCENEFFSYGQWIKAFLLFRNSFDIFVFVEDDYYPFFDHFDSKIIDVLKENEYLCTKAYPYGLKTHAAVANGFILTSSLKFLKDEKHFMDYMQNNPGKTQVMFSRYLLDNKIEINDFSHLYKPMFFNGSKLTHEFVRTEHNILSENDFPVFMPFQYTLT